MRANLDGDCARIEILTYIREFITKHGYSPSVREIMTGCGWRSPSTVQHHLDVMKAKGQIEFEPHIARSIRLRSDRCPPANS